MTKCWFTLMPVNIMVYLFNHQGEDCSAVKIYKQIDARYSHVWKILNILKRERLIIIKSLDNRKNTSSLTEKGKTIAAELSYFMSLWRKVE